MLMIRDRQGYLLQWPETLGELPRQMEEDGNQYVLEYAERLDSILHRVD